MISKSIYVKISKYHTCSSEHINIILIASKIITDHGDLIKNNEISHINAKTNYLTRDLKKANIY